MNDTIVITSIYADFWGSKEFRKSVDRVGLPLVNAHQGHPFTGNGDAIRRIYDTLKSLRGSYTYAIYADGADSYFISSFTPPVGTIVYSTEKACYPDPHRAIEFPQTESPWKYLNGGGYCGPIEFLIEYFEKYGLDKLHGDINGQREQTTAYLKAYKDNFPIWLDSRCDYFQTTAFAEPEDFGIIKDHEKIEIVNNITKTKPALLHGNGRTNMSWIYNLYGE